MSSIFSSFIQNNDKFAAVLNLFGCINVQYSSHAVRGLNIVIRLVKTLPRISWPRLVLEREKLRWIQYNLEAHSDESKDGKCFSVL